jgi:quercetin dioxygenase-like cupin family protein
MRNVKHAHMTLSLSHHQTPESISCKGRRTAMHNAGKVSLAIVVSAVLVVFVMCVGALPLTAQAQGQVSEKVLFEKVVELPSKNVNVKIRRMTFPVGFKTPEHTHEGPGPRYILRGKLELIAGGVTETYGAGEVFWEAGTPMTAGNVGGEEAEFIIIELLPVK